MKYKIVSVLFALLIASGFFLQIFLPDKSVSYEERRSLVQFPSVSAPSVLDGRWMAQFDKYVADQFPGREKLRTLKNGTELFVFGKQDVSGIYEKDGGLYANAVPSEMAVAGFAQKLALLGAAMPEAMHIYYAVIPDKSAMIDAGLHPVYKTDDVYDAISEAFCSTGKKAQPLHFEQLLSSEDFYKTDIHWRQEKLWPVVSYLAEMMRFSGTEDIEAVQRQFSRQSYAPFYGAYYGQYALPIKPDELYYLTGDVLDAVKVTDKTTGEALSVYSTDRLGAIDSYDVFLNGAAACIELENDKSLSDKELILFRDSYGSALAPLLSPFYKKITMIDLRYMPSAMIDDFVTYEDQDVLFLYSAMLANQSGLLK